MLARKGIFAKPSMMQLRNAQDSEAVKICFADFPAIIIPYPYPYKKPKTKKFTTLKYFMENYPAPIAVYFLLKLEIIIPVPL